MMIIKVFVTRGVTALPFKKISSQDLRKEGGTQETMKDALILETSGYPDRWRRKTSQSPMQLFLLWVGKRGPCRI
jgi:hypothetical protein